MLCEPCLTLVEQVKNYKEEYQHHHNEHELRASVQAGCRLCLLIADHFVPEGFISTASPTTTNEEVRNLPSSGIKLRVGEGDDSTSHILNFFDSIQLSPGSEFSFLRVLLKPWEGIYDQDRRRANGQFHSSPASSSSELPGLRSDYTGSSSSIECAVDWLKNCQRTHLKCRYVFSQPRRPLPTRLVCITKDNNGLDVRLCLGKDLPGNARYITLSHCWGSEQNFRLLASNFEALRQQIPLAELNKVMQDAVDMATVLGVRYLWIDSLCIIQDSPEDWRYESARMGDVYKDGLCNIAATGFPSGRFGLFAHRNPLALVPFRDYVGSHRPDTLIRHGQYEFISRDMWTNGVDEAPLSKRAWVVQERFLSPRVLHFGSKQLYWECQQTQACEVFSTGIPFDVPLRVTKSESPLNTSTGSYMYEKTSRIPPSSDRQAIYDYWNDVVSTYSSGKLTYPDDKLIAISGIAREVYRLLQERYLAGMWEGDLRNQLLWSTGSLRNRMAPSRPTRYIAPSWSWASIGTGVVPVESMGDPAMVVTYFAEIVETHIEPQNEDAMGHIASGYLRIRGSLVTADAVDAADFVSVAMKPQKVLVSGAPIVMDLWRDFGDEAASVLYCMPIRQQIQQAAAYFAFEGLLLRPTGPETGVYRRVGMFVINNKASCARLHGEVSPLADEYYEEYDGDGKYTIRII